MVVLQRVFGGQIVPNQATKGSIERFTWIQRSMCLAHSTDCILLDLSIQLCGCPETWHVLVGAGASACVTQLNGLKGSDRHVMSPFLCFVCNRTQFVAFVMLLRPIQNCCLLLYFCIGGSPLCAKILSAFVSIVLRHSRLRLFLFPGFLGLPLRVLTWFHVRLMVFVVLANLFHRRKALYFWKGLFGYSHLTACSVMNTCWD